MDHNLSTAQMGSRDPPFLSGNPTGNHRGSDQSGVSDGFLSGQTHPTPGPVPTLSYHLTDNPAIPSSVSVVANEKFINEAQASDNNHVQFATYNEKRTPAIVYPTTNVHDAKNRIPLPLRPYFWVPLIIFLVAAAIALEVALHFSNKRQGWPAALASSNSSVALHYAYTLPPVIIAALIVASWAWTDIEIKKMQPYVDLVHGDSPPHRSLLLDYTRDNNFFVWRRAAANRHYLVAIASLMALLTLSFQPLAAALLVVKDTYIQLPDVTMTNLAKIGLNQDSQFADLTSFLSGAGYAGASVLYDLPAPPFIQVPYTVAPFELPISTTNGTAFANTTALKTFTGCQSVPVQMTQQPDSGWLNEASFNNCSFTFSVANNSEIQFDVDTPTCSNVTPAEFSPVVFWFFSYVPTAIASTTFCYPSFSLWEVTAGVDIRTGNITSITELRPFTASSNFSSTSANVTGNPLDGRAYNGIAFDLTNPDQFVLARQNATNLQLPASVYQAALKTPTGFFGSFQNATLSTLADEVYALYLALVAKEVYFLSDNEPINVQVKAFQQRVWLSAPAVHLLTVAFLILAVFGTLVHLFHFDDRRSLRLTHLPGTIASAVSIGAQTGVGDVLAGRHAEEDLKQALADKRFRLNPDTMRLIMDSEDGYEMPASLDVPPGSPGRRRTMMNMVQGRRASKRFSVAQSLENGDKAETQTGPRSPHTPRMPNSLPKSPATAPGPETA
ncbi:hypothetical protein BJ912DRAFT_31550 [Pholiota molesta]|nr:hypothetical protein BJ912DRAFT_31550 [Pholiota molesta]